MLNVLVRLQLPDRPGALGAVASRVGSVGGDLLSVDILQRDNGVVIDELGVGLPADGLLDLLRDEILEVDGVSIEVMRVLDGAFPDRDAELLDLATQVFMAESPGRLAEYLTARIVTSLGADFAAVLDSETLELTGASGTVPEDDHLRATVRWASSPIDAPYGADQWEEEGLSSLATAREVATVAAIELVHAGQVLVVERSTPVLRTRERQWVAIMAELTDHGWLRP